MNYVVLFTIGVFALSSQTDRHPSTGLWLLFGLYALFADFDK